MDATRLPRPVRDIVLRAGIVVLAVVGLLTVPAQPARAADGESIPSYDTRVEIRSDGQLRVTETIQYDFGSNQRHGIIRRIPARFHYDDTQDRIYPIGDVAVSQDGQPVPLQRSSSEGMEVFKIGDEDRVISGVHRYLIAYTVRGALNSFADHEELYWNAIGHEWSVPIQSARVVVTVPGPAGRVTQAACFAGPTDSHLPCADQSIDTASATFGQTGLAAGSGLTVVVGLPKGSVGGTGPILLERHDLTTMFRVTPLAIGAGAALALVGIALSLAIAWRVGRDRRYVGLLPGLVPEPGEQASEKRKPLLGKPPVSVEFVPPERIRPGQVGTLIDERANVLDVTATIVDFAVRRHLHIKELPKAPRQDWELTKLTDGDPKFRTYERTLFRAIFAGRDRVRLSELRTTFASDLGKVRKQLYADMVAQGWYRESPARTRAAARGVAVLILLGAIGATVLLGFVAGLGLVGIGLIVGALALLIGAGSFPARTGRGSAMLERVQGFRLYVATAEAEQIRFQEREKIFSEYLPYAMVFGLAERWAGIFGDIAARQPDGTPRDTPGLYWYTGVAGFSLVTFNQSIGSFTTTTTGAVAATPASAAGSSGFGGGGFSGGGAGGGGGGSW